jgi:hypothetical protein
MLWIQLPYYGDFDIKFHAVTANTICNAYRPTVISKYSPAVWESPRKGIIQFHSCYRTRMRTKRKTRHTHLPSGSNSCLCSAVLIRPLPKSHQVCYSLLDAPHCHNGSRVWIPFKIKMWTVSEFFCVVVLHRQSFMNRFPVSKQPQYLYDIYLMLYVQSYNPDNGRRDCRVLFQNKINLKYCASSWFYYINLLQIIIHDF